MPEPPGDGTDPLPQAAMAPPQQQAKQSAPVPVQYDREQKSMDARLKEGTLGRTRRQAISAEARTDSVESGKPRSFSSGALQPRASQRCGGACATAW